VAVASRALVQLLCNFFDGNLTSLVGL
jgi:hypothetical protein